MIGDAIKNKYLWISSGILTLFYCMDGGIFEFGGAGGQVFDMIHGINSIGSSGFIMPVACTLPAALCYYEEKVTNTYRYKLIRTNRLSYAIRCVGKGMIEGAFVVGISMVFLLSAFFLKSAVQGNAISFLDESGIYGTIEDATIYAQLFAQGRGWIVLLLNIFMMMLNGMLWPCFGILVSAFVKNRKLLLVFPFLLYRVFAYIYNYNEYLTPIPFNMTKTIVYEEFGGFVRVALYLLAVAYLTVICLMANMKYQYIRGE